MAAADAPLVYGLHAVRALLQRRPQALRVLHVDSAMTAPDITTLAAGHGIPTRSASRGELDRLSGDGVHQGIVGVLHPAAALGEADLEALLVQRARPLLLVLDSVQDPHNLGACLRSADGAGVDAVIIPQRRAAGLGPAVRKVASGAAECVPLIVVTNLARTLRTLRDAGVRVVGADASGPGTLWEADLRGPLALVLGGEGQGLRALTRTLCDELRRLPMLGSVGSLNVSVAAGVCLYEALRQRGDPGSA